jgi:hypothetical protein
MPNPLHCCQHVVLTSSEGGKAAGVEIGEGRGFMIQGGHHKLGFSHVPLDPPVQGRDRVRAN